MMTLEDFEEAEGETAAPIEMLESYFAAHGWSHERSARAGQQAKGTPPEASDGNGSGWRFDGGQRPEGRSATTSPTPP